MVREINNELDKRREMDIGDELRYLARCSANTRTGQLGFLEHAYYHFKQQSKSEAQQARFSDVLDANLKQGSIDKP